MNKDILKVGGLELKKVLLSQVPLTTSHKLTGRVLSLDLVTNSDASEI